MTGEWVAGQRIPAVKELAADLGVNTRTVMRAYEQLTADNVVYMRRGMGYYCADDARSRVAAAQRADFFATTLPHFVARMRALGITAADIADALPPDNV